VRTGIGQTTLILGGEVDAVWDVKPEPPDTLINWVELKTSADPCSERDLQAFERKLMKFWIQSFLLGVPKIIVGFRDRNGILIRVEEMETAKIPSAVKKGRGMWDGNMCINFTAAFLQRTSPYLYFLLLPIFRPVCTNLSPYLLEVVT
jgi:RAT1-interacting protein